MREIVADPSADRSRIGPSFESEDEGRAELNPDPASHVNVGVGPVTRSAFRDDKLVIAARCQRAGARRRRPSGERGRSTRRERGDSERPPDYQPELAHAAPPILDIRCDLILVLPLDFDQQPQDRRAASVSLDLEAAWPAHLRHPPCSRAQSRPWRNRSSRIRSDHITQTGASRPSPRSGTTETRRPASRPTLDALGGPRCPPSPRSPRAHPTGFASRSPRSRSAPSSASAPAPRRAWPPPAASTSTPTTTPPPAKRCSTPPSPAPAT